MLPDDGIEIRHYVASDGTSPFERWFTKLDRHAAAKVAVAMDRLGRGAVSNLKSVREDVAEYRID